MPTTKTTSNGTTSANSRRADPRSPARRRASTLRRFSVSGYRFSDIASRLESDAPLGAEHAIAASFRYPDTEPVFSARAAISVLHPALRLGRQRNFLQVQRSEREIELKRVLEAYDRSALCRLVGRKRRVEQRLPANTDIATYRTRESYSRVDARKRGRSVGVHRDLRRVDARGLHYRSDCAGHGGIKGSSVSAGCTR